MKKYIISSAILVLMCLPVLVNAQPSPPSGPPCWPPPCVPVDNGILFMIFAIVGYGGWKIYDTKKKQELKTKAE